MAKKIILLISIQAFTCLSGLGSTPTELSLQRIGKSELTWFGFSIYTATLLAESEKKTMNQSLSLELHYQRDFKGSNIFSQTIKEFQHLGYDGKTIKNWIPLFKDVFPNIKKGDRIKAVYIPDKGIYLYYNDTILLRKIKNLAFAKAFISIWLSEKTSQPEMRKELFGVQN